jgi:hypothetical protein
MNILEEEFHISGRLMFLERRSIFNVWQILVFHFNVSFQMAAVTFFHGGKWQRGNSGGGKRPPSIFYNKPVEVRISDIAVCSSSHV